MSNQPVQQKSFSDIINNHPMKLIVSAIVIAVGLAWGVFNEVKLKPAQEKNEVSEAKLKECQEKQTSQEILAFNNDPLEISGKWNYTVWADQGKKVRARNPTTNKFEEKYLKIKGDITVDTISKETRRYKITGTRTGLIDEKGMNVMPIERIVPLIFQEVDYDKYSSQQFSFKFEVSIGADFGFVRLSEVTPRKMVGRIHYLYADQQWRNVNIEFKRQD